MSKERDEYLDVKGQYDKTKELVKEMVATAQRIVNAINDNPTRKDIDIKMIPIQGLHQKPRKIPSVFSVIDEWPDVKQIHSNLGILNDLFLKTNKLWPSIPPSERGNLTPPDKELRIQETEPHK